MSESKEVSGQDTETIWIIRTAAGRTLRKTVHGYPLVAPFARAFLKTPRDAPDPWTDPEKTIFGFLASLADGQLLLFDLWEGACRVFPRREFQPEVLAVRTQAERRIDEWERHQELMDMLQHTTRAAENVK